MIRDRRRTSKSDVPIRVDRPGVRRASTQRGPIVHAGGGGVSERAQGMVAGPCAEVDAGGIVGGRGRGAVRLAADAVWWWVGRDPVAAGVRRAWGGGGMTLHPASGARRRASGGDQ